MSPKEIVAIFIRHPEDGRFFVHQRSAEKKTFPFMYGIGAGGHRELDETIEDGAKRELREEAGLETAVRYLFCTETKIEDLPQIDYVFETIGSIEVLPRHDEWRWSGWMTKTEIDELLKAGALCTDTAENWQKYRLTF